MSLIRFKSMRNQYAQMYLYVYICSIIYYNIYMYNKYVHGMAFVVYNNNNNNNIGQFLERA